MSSIHEAEIIESATTAIEHILRMPILERHKRDLIKKMLWKITVVRGKYKTRYRSRAALAKDAPKLQHEHVFTLKDLTERLLAEPDRARAILCSAVGCVVTIDEHRRLSEVCRKNPSLRGWDRYKGADIKVVDTDAE